MKGKRAKFSLSNYKLLSCDMGELVPCGLVEVLPGDSIQHQSAALIRVSPLIAPMMHTVSMRIHHWFVPTRLLWSAFEDFITGGPDGLNASIPPTRTFTPGVGTVYDYLGIPVNVASTFSTLPLRAYNLIFNEWYRDQDLTPELVINTGSGNDATTTGTLQNVAWEKDYFTTARPWPQKGPQVTIPIGGEAEVVFEEGASVRHLQRSTASAAGAVEVTEAGGGSGTPITAFADLSSATSVSITDLREALALQRFAEARARYGSRYSEYLRYYGVRSSDARLQRPEYLGGSKQVLQISEILQTAPTTGGSAVGVGDLKGHGIGAMRSRRYRRYFEEHGYIVSLLSVKPKTMYVQGLPRMFSRATKEDYFQKELQHIGQMEILNKEVYAGHASPDAVFGYQDRYDDYRRIENTIAGEFRTTLDFWHMARIFASAPALNSAFVVSNPTKRVNAVQTNDVLWCQIHHSIQARRLLAKKGSSFTF